ncbi:unnamed protein product [Gadus morhua 'NCC']
MVSSHKSAGMAVSAAEQVKLALLIARSVLCRSSQLPIRTLYLPARLLSAPPYVRCDAAQTEAKKTSEVFITLTEESVSGKRSEEEAKEREHEAGGDPSCSHPNP